MSHKRIYLIVAVVFASAIVSTVALAGGGSGTNGPVAATRSRGGPLTSRADRFRLLARQVTLARNRVLHGKRVLAGAEPSGNTLAVLRDVALEMAALNGEAAPTNGVVYASTRKAAEQNLSGDTVDTDQPVFAITLHGHFVGYQAETLQSGVYPTGSVMTIVFDAQTLSVTDWGIMPAAPDASSLGAGTPLGL